MSFGGGQRKQQKAELDAQKKRLEKEQLRLKKEREKAAKDNADRLARASRRSSLITTSDLGVTDTLGAG